MSSTPLLDMVTTRQTARGTFWDPARPDLFLKLAGPQVVRRDGDRQVVRTQETTGPDGGTVPGQELVITPGWHVVVQPGTGPGQAVFAEPNSVNRPLSIWAASEASTPA